ncbi:MAG TPA: hypothetical protein VE338_02030 [Ktedonobacterales bacterium]|nr:hypothetical protein [Ktedonobacterales bacterium]
MLTRLLNFVVRANFAVQLVAGAFIVLGIGAYYVLLAREGATTQPSWMIVVAPVAVTLLWLIVAGVAMLLTVREDQRMSQRMSQPEPVLPTPPQTPLRTPVTPPGRWPLASERVSERAPEPAAVTRSAPPTQ